MISDDFRGLEAILPQTVYLGPPTPRFNQENLSQKICMLGKPGTEFSICQRKSGGDGLMNVRQTSPLDICFQSTSV